MSLFDKTETVGTTNKPAQARDPFQKIEDAEDTGSSAIYADPGVYPILSVDVLKMITSRKGDDLFIAELEILESKVPSRPAGTRLTWISSFRHESTPGKVKQFLATLYGTDPDQVKAEEAKYACSEKNPCSGRLVRLEAVMVRTKAGNPFTRHDWRPISDEIQKRASELREAAGFTPF